MLLAGVLPKAFVLCSQTLLALSWSFPHLSSLLPVLPADALVQAMHKAVGALPELLVPNVLGMLEPMQYIS